MLHPGVAATVKEVYGGERALYRLTELGLVKGAVLSLLQNMPGGSLIVSLKGSRIAIGRGLAMKVAVEVQEAGDSAYRKAAL
ncbi:MAG: FeoA domain-containing protein [Bacillota bacterium]